MLHLGNNPVQIAFRYQGALLRVTKMTHEEICERYEMFCKTAEARNVMYLEDKAFAEWEKTTNDEQKAEMLPNFLRSKHA
jgi:hypothetical protein